MKRNLAKRIQQLFTFVAVNSYGRSFPLGMHEREISESMKIVMEKKIMGKNECD